MNSKIIQLYPTVTLEDDILVYTTEGVSHEDVISLCNAKDEKELVEFIKRLAIMSWKPTDAILNDATNLLKKFLAEFENGYFMEFMDQFSEEKPSEEEYAALHDNIWKLMVIHSVFEFWNANIYCYSKPNFEKAFPENFTKQTLEDWLKRVGNVFLSIATGEFVEDYKILPRKWQIETVKTGKRLYEAIDLLINCF